MKKEITSGEDIELLVHTFYDKVRKHETLGPIFNEAIQDWDAHLIRLCDFWESNLLYIHKFRGNPPVVHAQLDDERNNDIEQAHFGNWLTLWFQTIDHFFEGQKAHEAKERARNMAHMLFMYIYQARKDKSLLKER